MKNTHKLIVIIILLLTVPACKEARSTPPAEITGFAAKRGSVELIREDGTVEAAQGLPDDIQVNRFYPFEDGSIYCSTMKSGLFQYLPETGWKQLLNDEFKRRTMLEGVDEYRKVTGFARSPENKDRIAVAVKHAVYTSENNGETWNKLADRIKIEDYVTSLAIDSCGSLYIGTSYNGIYRLHNDTYTNISKGLYYELYVQDVLFYETIAHIEEVNGTLYASQLFNKGLFSFNGEEWAKEELSSDDPVFYVHDLMFDGSTMYAAGDGFLYKKGAAGWTREQADEMSADTAASLYKINGRYAASKNHIMSGSVRNETQKLAAGKKAIYTNIHMLKKNTDGLIRVIKQSGLNTLVIDVKDDYGDVLADIDSEKARKIGSLRNTVDFTPYLKKLHDENIWVIARMVVFKDKRLFRAFDGKYAIWDSKYNRPWRAQNREYWCDAHSDYVREYNIELANAVAEIGFDEIQFDYIRFPADGSLERCEYRYKKYPDMFKSEVLDDFLQQARAEISAPISVDIYGFTAFYNFGNRIGQDIEVFGKHVDAVSAMIYPSHYGYAFYMKGPREERPYRIVYDTGIRSRFLSNDAAVMRPYLQAFDMKSPTFGTGYINYQVDACDDSGCDGYIFWHAGGSYGVVRRALSAKAGVP